MPTKSKKAPKRRAPATPVASFAPRTQTFVRAELVEALRFQPREVNQARQERAIKTKQKIIEVALKLFAIKGYDGVSTHEVSAQAEITQGLITYHFKSKEGLWQAAIDLLFGELRNQLVTRVHELRGVDEANFFKLLAADYIYWAAQNPFLVRFILQEGKDPSARLEWLVKRHIVPIYNFMADLIQSGQKHGIIQEGPVLNIYYQLMGSALVFAVGPEIKILSGEDSLSQAFIDKQIQCISSLLFRES